MNLDTTVTARSGVTLDSARLNGFHAKLALFSSEAQASSDGYILSIIGIAMVQIQAQWDMSALWWASSGLRLSSASSSVVPCSAQ